MRKAVSTRLRWLTVLIATVGGLSVAAGIEHSRDAVSQAQIGNLSSFDMSLLQTPLPNFGNPVGAFAWRRSPTEMSLRSTSQRVAGKIRIPFGPHALFAPFERRDVVAIMTRWRSMSSENIEPEDLAYSGHYDHWKARAEAYIEGLVDQGRVAEARNYQNWLNTFELRQQDANQESPRSVPSDLMAAAGGPPPAAFRGVQSLYTVSLPGVNQKMQFLDHPVDPDYPYLINPTGIDNEGIPVYTRPDTPHLMRLAGLNHDQRLVFQKVSEKEGGFEAVNTYDTGYVSVGFIQFAAMRSGDGSLARLLEHMRAESPKDYLHYFQKFGIDVDDRHSLSVVDPWTGKVLHGAEAVDAIIYDKRLTAVFYHAGQGSEGFQRAQIEEALNEYYAPAHGFSVAAAKVEDYSDPDQPVATYYYGDSAVASAETSVAARNGDAWTPASRPEYLDPVANVPPGGLQTTGATQPQGVLETSDTTDTPVGDQKRAPKSSTTYSGTRYRFVRLANLRGLYGDVFQSVAGRTAITDRCVQRGYAVGPVREGLQAKFEAAIGTVAAGRPVTVRELASRERDLIPIVQNRILVLADADLNGSAPTPRLARALYHRRPRREE